MSLVAKFQMRCFIVKSDECIEWKYGISSIMEGKIIRMRIMDVKKKAFAGKFCVIGGGLLLSLVSQFATAASYQSTVTLPTIYTKNFTETANVPVVGAPPASARITNVSWTWSVVGWPTALTVVLCQGASNCVDVSRVRSGSSAAFNAKSPSQPFFFALRIGSTGVVPIAGQTGKVIVSW